MLASALAVALGAAPCPDTGTALVVETGAHRLTLCEAGVAQSTHRVAIGSGGVAKKRVGWAQTPLGTFTLATPRASAQFHTFIPLVNPDPKRFSAWAIGLHGPPRATKDDGDVNIDTDWTWGCIALRADQTIDEVAAWVREKKVTRVDFRE